MLELLIYIIIWCLCVYGLMSIFQDISRSSTYKKIEKNIKLIMTVKNVEEGIENYVRELSFGRNFFNNLVIIDMDSNDDTLRILRELEEENVNMKILTKKEGEGYLQQLH